MSDKNLLIEKENGQFHKEVLHANAGYVSSFGNKVSLALPTVKYWRIENADSIQSLLGPVENFASSFGLQPFRIIVTEDKNSPENAAKKKQNLLDESWQLVFAVRTQITKSDIDNFIDGIRGTKKYSTNSLASYRKIFEDSINSKDESGSTWAEKQAHAGLDILLASARQIKSEVSIDEKIDADLFDNVLGLDKDGYTSLLSVSIRKPDKSKLVNKSQSAKHREAFS